MGKVWMWVRHDGSAWIEKTRVVWPCSPPLFLCLSVRSKRTVFLIQQGNSYCAADLWKPLAVRVVSGLETFRVWWFRVVVLVRVYEVFVCRCATRVLKVYECVRQTLELLPHYIFESKVQQRTGALFSFLLQIGAQRAFLSCESEDRGHRLSSKLALGPLWFRGLSHVCTHTYTHTMHHQSPWKETPHLFRYFHLI